MNEFKELEVEEFEGYGEQMVALVNLVNKQAGVISSPLAGSYRTNLTQGIFLNS